MLRVADAMIVIFVRHFRSSFLVVVFVRHFHLSFSFIFHSFFFVVFIRHINSSFSFITFFSSASPQRVHSRLWLNVSVYSTSPLNRLCQGPLGPITSVRVPHFRSSVFSHLRPDFDNHCSLSIDWQSIPWATIVGLRLFLGNTNGFSDHTVFGGSSESFGPKTAAFTVARIPAAAASVRVELCIAWIMACR